MSRTVFVIDREVEIEVPATVVWQVISDLAAYGEWNPFVTECRSSLRAGDPIEMQARLGRRASRQVEWMIGIDPGRGFSYRMRPLPLAALCSLREHHIEPLGETRCRYRSHFGLRGWLMPLVRALLASAVRRTGFARDRDRRRARVAGGSLGGSGSPGTPHIASLSLGTWRRRKA